MIKPNVVYPETPFPEGSAMHEVRLLSPRRQRPWMTPTACCAGKVLPTVMH